MLWDHYIVPSICPKPYFSSITLPFLAATLGLPGAIAFLTGMVHICANEHVRFSSGCDSHKYLKKADHPAHGVRHLDDDELIRSFSKHFHLFYSIKPNTMRRLTRMLSRMWILFARLN